MEKSSAKLLTFRDFTLLYINYLTDNKCIITHLILNALSLKDDCQVEFAKLLCLYSSQSSNSSSSSIQR